MKRKLSYFSSVVLSIAILLLIVSSGLFANAESTASDGYIEVTTPYKEVFSAKTLTTGFLYSDQMLLVDQNALSTDIAKVSVALAMAAYNESHIDDVYTKMGFERIDDGKSYDIVDNLTFEDNDHVAYTIARKKIGKYMAYCVPVKGTSRNAEWFSDFNLGTTGNHEGFYLPAYEVQAELDPILANDGYDPNETIVLLTGHSRGAAVSNIIAGHLTSRNYRVFGYTFACPSPSKNVVAYDNIYNFNIAGDMIPALPLEEWHYGRYGHTITMHLTSDGNFLNRYSSEIGRRFNAASSTEEYVALIKQLIPTEANFYDTHVQLILNLAAWGLGGKVDVGLEEILVSTNLDIGNDLLNRIKNMSTLHNLQTALDSSTSTYESYLEFIDEHRVSVKGMTDEEFAAFLTANSAMISSIAKAAETKIETIEDFLDAAYFVDDLSEAAITLGTEIIPTAMSLFFDIDGVNIAAAIGDGHTSGAYVMGINSMYFGYKGWYLGGATGVSIPPNVESIGAYCFASCTDLVEAAIPSGIKAIGNQAFSSCTSLNTNLNFGGEVAYLGNSAFYNCSSIVSAVDLSGPITSIGSSTFYGCTGIPEVIIPDRVEKIGSSAFYGCSGVKKITMPISCTYTINVGIYNTFQGCSSVEEIIYTTGNGTVFDAGYQSGYTYTLPQYAKESLLKVTYEEGITSLPTYALYYCSKITEVNLPSTLTTIGEYAFFRCSSLTSATIPQTVTNIGYRAFYECSMLTGALIIPDGVTTLSAYAFYGCSGLTELTIPDGVESIGRSAFYLCSGLKKVTLPISCEYDTTHNSTSDTFAGCDNVEEIIYTTGDGTVFEAGSKYSLPQHAKKSLLKVTFEEGIATLPTGVLNGCSKVTEVLLPSTLTMISNSAFCDCSSLTTMSIPESVTSIGDSAFRNCSMWESGFPIWETTEYIGTYSFYNCVNLIGSVKIPDDFTEVAANTFYGCTGIPEVIIPDRVEKIGSSAFYGCSGVKKITMPISCTYTINVGIYNTFQGCSSVEEIIYTTGNGTVFDAGYQSGYTYTLPQYAKESLLKVTYEEGITSLPTYALYYCSKITEVNLPSTLTTIGEYAFFRCSSLTSATIPQTVTNIGYRAFYECSMLTGALIIPDGVTTLSAYAFYGCSGLTELTIPDGVESIGRSAFYLCSGLKKVTLPISCEYDTTHNSTSDTFAGCDNVEEIIYTTGDGTVFEAGSKYSLPQHAKKSLLKVTFEEGIATLPTGVLNGCSKVTEVLLPSTLTMISNSAFCDCSSLTTMSIPESVTSIGDSAFSGCNSLVTIEFKGNAPTFGNNYCFNTVVADAYYNPNNDGWLEDNMLQNYGGTITWIPSEIAVILNYKDVDLFVSDYPFGDSVRIEATVIGYNGENSLVWTSSDESVACVEDGKIIGLQEGTVWITAAVDDESYAQCKVEVISDSPLMCLPAGTKQIAEEAFTGINALKAVVLNDQIESIGANAFSGCDNLAIINIPASVTEIADDAFVDCPNLRIYCFADGVGERYAIAVGIPYELMDTN